MMVYTNLVKNILDHCVAESGQNPDRMILGAYIANKIIWESSYIYKLEPQLMESLFGIPVTIDTHDSCAVDMLYCFKFHLPYDADEKTELYFENSDWNKQHSCTLRKIPKKNELPDWITDEDIDRFSDDTEQQVAYFIGYRDGWNNCIDDAIICAED